MPMSRRHSELPSFRYNITLFFLLYFVQGIPYGLQTRFLPIYFRTHGMSLANVSLYKLLFIPWALKPFFAPLIDSYGHKKTWLTHSMSCLSILCVAAALSPPIYAIQLAIVMFLFNIATSVQDIALDALVIERLTPAQLVKGNIAQVVGYKTGSLFSGGVFVIMTGLVSWNGIFYGLAFLYFLGIIGCANFIPYHGVLSSTDISRASRRSIFSSPSVLHMEDPNAVPHVQPAAQESSTSQLGCYFWKIFNTEGTGWMLVFTAIYKIGEQGVLNMFPMYLLDNNVSAKTVGFWTGFAGPFFSVLGSFLGGMYTHDYIFKSLKFHMILRGVSAFTILLSVWFWNSFSSLSYAVGIISLLVVFFAGGAITTTTYTVIMLMSKQTPRQCRASHYTTLATADVLGRVLVSSAVGGLAQWTSYSFVFSLFSAVSFLAIMIMSQAPLALQHM